MAVTAQALAAIIHHTAEVELTATLADGRVSGQAVAAMATVREGQHHMVAHFHVADIVTDLLDHTGTFMAEHDRIRGDAQVACGGIGMADPGGHDTYQNLVTLGGRQFDVLEVEGLALGGGDGGANFHGVDPVDDRVMA